MPEPFIQLRGGAATPLPPRRHTPGVPPPPPPAPGQQGGVGGGGHIHQQAPPGPAPPPFPALPPNYRGRPAVQISDIRPERMTEGDARERLTTFKVVRFERSAVTNEMDWEGKQIKPTWAKCSIIDENDIEQFEARRMVRALDKERNKEGHTVTVTEKKAALPPTLKFQLEKQQGLLQNNDDHRWVTTLVQLEDMTRPLEDGKGDKKKDGKSDSKDKQKKDKKYDWEKFDSKKSSADKKSKTKLKERVAVRAYYKRSPAQDQDAMQLYHQHQAAIQQMRRHQQDHEFAAGVQRQQAHQAQMNPPPPPPPPNDQQPQNGTMPPIRIVQDIGGQNGRPGSPHSSDGSSYYGSGWSDSEGEDYTPQSSVGSHIDGKHRHRRRERKHQKDKKYFNVGRGVPRTLPVAENVYVVTRAPPGATAGAPALPQPRFPPEEIDRLRSIRYWEEDREALDRREEEPRRRTIEPAYTYHTVERRRSFARLSPVETRRERFDDLDFEREAVRRFERRAAEDEARERERDRRAEEAAHERYVRDRYRPTRVVVTSDRVYEDEGDFHAPYIRDPGPTYMEQAAGAQEYMDSHSDAFGSRPFTFRPRRRGYDERSW